jgi:hypothetical protein
MVRPENFAGVAHGTFAEYRNLSLEAISLGYYYADSYVRVLNSLSSLAVTVPCASERLMLENDACNLRVTGCHVERGMKSPPNASPPLRPGTIVGIVRGS